MPNSVNPFSSQRITHNPPFDYAKVQLVDAPDHHETHDPSGVATLNPQSSASPLRLNSDLQDVEASRSETIKPFRLEAVQWASGKTSWVECYDMTPSFAPRNRDHTLLDDAGQETPLSLSAHLQRNYFYAATPRAEAHPESDQSNHLTCYRRNYLPIIGSVTLCRAMQYIRTEQGDRFQITALELCLSATESVHGKSVKLLSPWYNPNATTRQRWEQRAPASIPLDTTARDESGAHVTFPFTWEQLQFGGATANNWNRKGPQGYFIVKVAVMATLSTGDKMSIAEAQLAPIVVRGRNPAHIVRARVDKPVGGAKQYSKVLVHPKL